MPMKLRIRNHKDGPATIVVNEPIGGDWEMVSSTFEARKDSGVRCAFNVPVAKTEKRRCLIACAYVTRRVTDCKSYGANPRGLAPHFC